MGRAKDARLASMKLRNSTKRRIASALAKLQGRKPWTAEEVACIEHALQSLLDADILVRALSLPRIKQGQSFTVWRPRQYL